MHLHIGSRRLLHVGAFAMSCAAATVAVSQQEGAASLPDLRTLPMVKVTYDSAHERLTVEFPPEDLPAVEDRRMMYMRTLSPHQAIIPVSGTIYSIRTQMVDSAGRVLPRALLHHVNLTDPTHRELFLPISLHLFAASRETPPVDIPRLILGVPLDKGQRLLLTAMVANDRRVAYRGARIQVILGFRPTGRVFP